MSLTASNPFPLNSKAADFLLPDTVSGNKLSIKDISGERGTVVLFICNHCPYVIHVNEQLVTLAKDYLKKDIGFVAISSNDVLNYPDDAPELMTKQAARLNYPFPYLYDESQKVAKAYDAACTPDIYLFNAELKSVYHGQLDGSRPGNNITSTGIDLRAACDALLSGNLPLENQLPSMGCNIKWKT